MSELRNKRVEELIAREIGSLVVAGEIKDPRVSSFLSVTRVEAAKDFSAAKVFVSTFEGDDRLDDGIAGLNSAAGFIQATLAKKMRLRLTPRLTFLPDRGLKAGFEMMKKIETLVSHDGN